MVGKQHGMIEWLKNITEYNASSGGSMPDALMASITRAVRSGSKTVVFFGTEFNPENDTWDDVIECIERNMLDTQRVQAPAEQEARLQLGR